MGQHNSTEGRPIKPEDLIKFAYLKSPNRETFDYFQLLIQSKDTESLELAFEELEVLSKFNQEHVVESSRSGPRGQYLNTHIVEAMMRMCDRFNVSDHVKFHSLELFNRWMALFAEDFQLHTKKLRKYNLKTQITKQNMTLVMASCIQLASKYVGRQTLEFYEMRDITDYLSIAYRGTDNNMVSGYAILQLLTNLYPKAKYTLDKVIESEGVVFRRFAYNLKATSVMEIIESIIVLFFPKATEFQKIYALCLIAVDFYYLRKGEVFGEYQKIMIKAGLKMDSLTFTRHQSDYIFIAVSIIHLIISQDPSPTKPNIPLSQLQMISGNSSDEISFLTSAFAKFLLVKDNLIYLLRESSITLEEGEVIK